jgi:hypothetical protein
VNRSHDEGNRMTEPLDLRALADELWEANKQFVDALVRVELAARRDEEKLQREAAPSDGLRRDTR